METDRILLRHWLDSDAETLFKYASDPDVGPRAGWPPHKSVEESLEVIRTVFNKDTTTWAIVLKETNEVIGAMGYGESCNCNLPTREGEPIVGYWVAKPYWNMGYCTEALRLMIDHIRRTTSLTSLLSGHFVDNPASGRVMQKCGFVPTGEVCYDESLYMGQDRPVRVLRLELNNMIAFCGLDCKKCDAYRATINNDQVLREKTAKLWAELNNAPILPEHINCEGCRVDGVKTVFCQSLCGIRQCALKKGVTTCGDCPTLEECQTIKMVTDNNPDALRNLKRKQS